MKLHKILFSLLILFLPVQLGKHFWPDWTMVYGLRLDYLSPTLYFTDLLILGILIGWLAEKFIIFRHSGKRVKRAHPESDSGQARMTKVRFFLFSFAEKLCLFFIFLFFSCFSAQNQPAAFYKLIKILEFSFLGFYVAKNVKIDKLFSCSIAGLVIYSSLIAIVQFIKQGSVGGIFYWLGERTFTSGTPGIAQTIWNGELLLRPYATFPHPNVLAGFLVISLLLMTQFSIFNFQFPMKSQFLKFSKSIRTLVIILGTVALFLTFSRVAWMVFGIALLIKAFFCHSRESGNPGLSRETWIPDRVGDDKKMFLFSVFLVSIFYFLLSTFPIQSESITYRQDLNLAAVKEWQSSPLVGVGLNNFLVRLPEFYQSSGEIRWFQPAHNIFLMVLAETGLIGLIGLIWFLIKTIRRLLLTNSHLLLTILIAILVLGLFDHYFYTLQQGQILLTIILGLCWSESSLSFPRKRESRTDPETSSG